MLLNEDGDDTTGYRGPLIYGDVNGGEADRLRLLNSRCYPPHCAVHP
ncbi:hypothetical protein ACWDKQ_16280 [Saccharopolyspora sp. NPDC000995]